MLVRDDDTALLECSIISVLLNNQAIIFKTNLKHRFYMVADYVEPKWKVTTVEFKCRNNKPQQAAVEGDMTHFLSREWSCWWRSWWRWRCSWKGSCRTEGIPPSWRPCGTPMQLGRWAGWARLLNVRRKAVKSALMSKQVSYVAFICRDQFYFIFFQRHLIAN